MLTDQDSKSEIKSLWSPADKPASQTTVPVRVHPCAAHRGDRWAPHRRHSLGRGLSLFWPIAKLYSLGILWQCVGCVVGKRQHWSEHQSQSQLSDAAFLEVNEEYSTFEQVTGACSQKAAQVCQENSLFWSAEGTHWKQTNMEKSREECEACMLPSWRWQQTALHAWESKKVTTGQRKEWVVCRFFLSLSFTEGLWCHWKSVPPG